MNDSMNSKLAEATAYFQKEAATMELTTRLQGFQEEGSERKPNHYDVLVHPSFAFDEKWTRLNTQNGFPLDLIIEWATNYYKQLLNLVMTLPSTTIIIHDNTEPGIAVTSFHDKIIKTYGGSAYLYPPELEKFFTFTQGINKEDTYSIHGSIWGRCPGQFSVQLHISSQLNGYINNGRSQQNLVTVLESGVVQKGPVKTGIQHNTALVDSINKYNAPFMDDNSVIIPSPEEVAAFKKKLKI